jgi:hypothetical protein
MYIPIKEMLTGAGPFRIRPAVAKKRNQDELRNDITRRTYIIVRTMAWAEPWFRFAY